MFLSGDNMNIKSRKPINKANLHEELTKIQYEVTQKGATEPPFQNSYWDNNLDGIYVDIVSKKPLFSSQDKFNSGCGWPSFSKPLGDVIEKKDFSHQMIRTEIRSQESNSHLGHIFEDGIKELGGLRYCINSASLEFIPYEKLEESGYGEYISIFGGVK